MDAILYSQFNYVLDLQFFSSCSGLSFLVIKETIPLLWVIATEAYRSDDFCLGSLQSLPHWKLGRREVSLDLENITGVWKLG